MSTSTKNTKISKSRCGCRPPYESPTAGDGYASPGEIKTYHMSPEELAKYGPVKQQGKKPDPTYYWKKKGEAEEMATRMEQAKEALTRVKYLTHKAEGKNDIQIMELVNLKYWPDIITTLKEEWGLKGITQEGAKKEIEAIKAAARVEADELVEAALGRLRRDTQDVDTIAPQKVVIKTADQIVESTLEALREPAVEAIPPIPLIDITENAKLPPGFGKMKPLEGGPMLKPLEELVWEARKATPEEYHQENQREEMSVFDAIKLFDPLEEQRDMITAQMEKIKAALDGVMVTI